MPGTIGAHPSGSDPTPRAQVLSVEELILHVPRCQKALCPETQAVQAGSCAQCKSAEGSSKQGDVRNHWDDS